jgi:cellulose synthase/poly-beta-1,6-N-acetylglucosamine synthase-like glycosyltransferase
MSAVAWTLLGGAGALVGYTYGAYPVLLKLLSRGSSTDTIAPFREWPMITITVPAYNEEAQIRGLLESLLRLDYPADRRQILIISDASTDRTDEIVREFADRGVELLRMPERGGKDAAESAARPLLRGEIVVNTDASIRIRPDALKPMIARFADPSVGLASGRDLSVGTGEDVATAGEGGYVGYEMWVRNLETTFGGIVGASGCFYAIRAELHRKPLPTGLSRDFASALITREHGFRAVSADDAVCFVPRSGSLRREYRRKVRTMSRGLQTLFHKRQLLNPVRYGSFSWMLFSHKLCRWLVPWAIVGGGVGIVSLALAGDRRAIGIAIGLGGVGALAALGWSMAERRPLPPWLGIPTFAVAANIAVLHAWLRALGGNRDPVWEPTRREVVESAV